MPNDFFVRITHSYEALRSLVSVWALECEKMAVYEHVGSQTEKIHCHMVILRSRITKKQLRNIGQRYVNLKGNENCSFKACESWETPMTYMTKGELEPKYFMGFTKQECDAARERWVEPAQVISKDRAVFNDCFNYHEYKNRYIPPTRCKEKSKHYPDWPEEVPHCKECEFDNVKVKANTFVFAKIGVWNMKALNMYKMLVFTYCFEEGIPIPSKSEWGKWL